MTDTKPETQPTATSSPLPGPAAPFRKPLRKHRLRPAEIHQFVEKLIGDDWHAQRIASLGDGVTGTLHAATLGIHAIGAGLAQAQGLNPRHATKQVDRLLSNAAIDVASFFEHWVPFVIGAREEVFVALDWTEFDGDDHSTLALYLITSHGRATPLMWKTVQKSAMEGWRNAHEDALLRQFNLVLHQAGRRTLKRLTILADRGFGDQKLYPYLEDLGFDYIIRFKGNITVEGPSGLTKTADQWILDAGRARMIKDPKVTRDKTSVPAVVVVRASGMKESWCLATSRSDLSASLVVKHYSKRFRIEETFRDHKDARFGMGLKATHIKSAARRDRLLILASIAHALLTLLGAAAEEVGLDRKLKVNTVKKRTHSLFRQGSYWYGAIPTMPEEWLRPLMESFARLVSGQRVFAEVFGVL